MIQKKVKVTNRSGLQSRAAAMFVQIANKFRSKVWLEIDNKKVDGKSILGLMSMGIHDGSTVTLAVSGDDEDEAAKYFIDFLRVPFDEQMYVKLLAQIPNHNDPDEMKRWQQEHGQDRSQTEPKDENESESDKAAF